MFNVINNSNKAVKKRLNYLRYPNVEDKAVNHNLMDEKIASCPRKIEWNYEGYSLCVTRHPCDVKHYKYNSKELKRIDLHRDDKHSDGTPYSLLDIVTDLMLLQRGNEYFPYMWEENAINIVIPYNFVKIKDISEAEYPKELASLGIRKEDWYHAWYSSLENYFWDGAGFYGSPTEIVRVKEGTEDEEIFNLRVEPIIYLTINGESCRHHNLTITEEGKILKSIREQNQVAGSFLSDGKELMEYRPKNTPKKMFVREVNSLVSYGER